MRRIYQKLLYGLLPLLLFGNRLMAQNTDYKPYQALVQQSAAQLGITKADAATAIITSAYTDPGTQLTYVYLQQAYQQVKVYNTIITATFRNDELVYHSGSFVKDIASKAGSSIPAKTYSDAAVAAARHLNLEPTASFSTIADRFATEKQYTLDAAGIAKRPIDVTLYWVASDDKQQVVLTWNVNVDVKGTPDWWNVRIDALTAAYVQKDNWTVSEHLPATDKQARSSTAIAPLKNETSQKPVSAPQLLLQAPPPNVTSASYRVVPFPLESPNYGAFNTVNNPWLLAGTTNNATSLGWHYDNTTNYTITRGNNVHAYLDRANSNTPSATTNWSDTSTTAAPSLNFVHTFSTTQQPTVTENQKAILDNLFYWNNIVHDISYQYGLNEVAGNFQQDNQGRGGLGADYVRAEAQDAGGTNNANFSTPADGTSGRMQMYLWSPVTRMQVNAPENITGTYAAVEGTFSTANRLVAVGPITNQVVYYNDNATGTTHFACGIGASPANTITGKIALIIRSSTCNYTEQVKNAQNAGAVGVIMVNSVAGSPVTMTGSDNTITIPAVMISQADGNLLMTQLNNNLLVNTTLYGGVNLDGDLDNGIIVHEYGHGISNRLTGGPANSGCLGNAEQGGEGWSDYFALMMTTNWGTATVNDGPNRHPIGTYAYGQFTSGAGIRRYPYSTNMSIDPLTYAYMAASTEVHNIGEIWCSALWDLTWALIQQQGITPNLYNSAATGGNVVAMNLVITGLKLQPCGPGFLDARDAILAADSVLYGYAHKCLIWNTFARRGMGASAIQGSANSATDQVAAYDLPNYINISQPQVRIANLNFQMAITHNATSNCVAVTGYTLRDTIPSGFTYVSSTPSGTLNGNVLTFPATSFNALETKTFTLVLRTPSTGCNIDSIVNDNREAYTAGGLTSSGTPGWSVSTAQSYSPSSSWYASEPTTITSSSLTSNTTARTTAQNLSILSFWHNYSTEYSYDGGVLEYSINGGTTWLDATSLYYQKPPTTVMDASTTLAGRKAFSGGRPGFQQSILNLASLGTTAVQFRFRMESDNGTGGAGWYVDDIIRANGCGGILKTGAYNSAGVRQDTLMQPIFVTPQAPLPVTLLWFYANAVGSQVALDWKTVSEINAKDFTLEWSIDGARWTTISNVAALGRNANSYNFIHTNPAGGINYYRIRMNDVDGRFSYSPVRTINMEGKNKPMVVLVPNPVNNNAVLYLSQEAKVHTVKVYDAAGSLVRQLSITAGAQQVKITTTNLAAGIYTVETTGNGRFTTRMLVQH